MMEDLYRATAAPVRAGWLAGPEVAYIEKAVGRAPVTRPTAAARLPAHATALGKTLMAFSSTRVVDPILTRGLKRYTRCTITRPEQLRWAFRSIRATRIAHCDRELDEEWCGIAAPVFGPGGAVLAAVELRVGDEDVSTSRSLLTLAAACLTRELAAQTTVCTESVPRLVDRRERAPIGVVRTMKTRGF
jgi:DNA-binding IclR family transcriptional regulator